MKNSAEVLKKTLIINGYLIVVSWARFTESRATDKVLELADIQGGESVLEVGVGTGMLFENLLKRNENGFTVGIDLSGDMLSKTKERCNLYQENRDFSLQQASVYDLSSFLEQKFDLLISCYMLDLLPESDFMKLLQSFRAVLNPSGKMVLSLMTFGWKWYHQGWELLINYFPKLFTDCRPINLVPYLQKADYQIKAIQYISQNTFPSQVVLARV